MGLYEFIKTGVWMFHSGNKPIESISSLCWLSLQISHSLGVLEYLTLSRVTWALQCAVCYSWRVRVTGSEHCYCAVNLDSLRRFQLYLLKLQLVHSHGVLEHLTLSHVTWALDCALCYSWRVCLISWEHCDCAVNVDRSAQFPAHCALRFGLTFLPSLTIPYLPSLTPILQPIFFCFCFACAHWNGQIKIANVSTF